MQPSTAGHGTTGQTGTRGTHGARRPDRGGGRRNLDAAEVGALVARAQRGDQEAFGLLYLEYRRRIFSVAKFSLSHAAAEDAVAETFVRAWAALPRYRETGAPFVAWLYGIARHVVVDTLRAAARVEPQSDPDRGALDQRDRADDRLALGDALAKLPPEQRTVIELKYMAGLSNEEVAVALGKSPGAVNTQQWRALGALRDLMGAE